MKSIHYKIGAVRNGTRELVYAQIKEHVEFNLSKQVMSRIRKDDTRTIYFFLKTDIIRMYDKEFIRVFNELRLITGSQPLFP